MKTLLPKVLCWRTTWLVAAQLRNTVTGEQALPLQSRNTM